MNDNMTPEQQRRLRVKIAANARWSRHMAREDQAVIARAAMLARLERQIDPEGKIPPKDRKVLVQTRLRGSCRRSSTRARRVSARMPAENPGNGPMIGTATTAPLGQRFAYAIGVPAGDWPGGG